jgi:LysR family transcriptional regulator, hydrogen peroxide-inducible genes activator
MASRNYYYIVYMQLDLLKSFLAVAEARSFSRAARMVHSTQPTLSRQIARLEADLGTRLFERYGRHVELAFSGQLLLPLAQAIVARTDDAIALMKEQSGAGASTVRLGAVGNVFALLLTPIVASFLEAYPRASLDLIEKDDAQLEQAVISGELDCAVLTPWGSTRAAAQHLLTEEILLVVPRAHPLASRRAVALGKLVNEPILLPRATMNAGNIVSDAFRRAGLEPKLSYRANYPELIKALVRKGFGVAPMPRMLVGVDSLEELVAIPFEEPLYRDLDLIYPRDRPLSAVQRALMAHIRAAVSALWT